VCDRGCDGADAYAVETIRCPIRFLTPRQWILGLRTELEKQAGSDCACVAVVRLDSHLIAVVEVESTVLELLDTPWSNTAAAAAVGVGAEGEGKLASVALDVLKHMANTMVEVCWHKGEHCIAVATTVVLKAAVAGMVIAEVNRPPAYAG
jgi:hypothetical protein